MTRHLLPLAFALLAVSTPAQSDEAEPLRILGEDTVFVVGEGDSAIEITRVMTPCAKNKGWLQPLVPVAGIHPASEIEVLHALNDPEAMVIDMREVDHYLEGTIPTAINIPYTEVAMRLDELGCQKSGDGWDCAGAKTVFGFCNGPVCPQSPTAMQAMVRDGFPADKIHYYRGGMLDWEALGLSTVEGEL